MIKLHDFSIGYGERTLLCEVETTIEKGRLTALIGRNGTGKSTLLRAIAGLNRRYTGRILLDEPTSFLDMPNRYELCTLLARLAHEENKCILFSTHELDIALSLADAIALIDPPQLSYMPTEEMRRSGCIERLFRNNCVTFDATTGFIKVGQ
ncbi:ATP-binding cassette domain-containing protein [Bacteroides xylanisolvens]|uniref:ATP-binding cassette domain-containing protein n=1 Tax=Bacteroides xylanisolvens TaxID=371601 RepID=UPI0035159F94